MDDPRGRPNPTPTAIPDHQTLFQTWRGHVPFAPRLTPVRAALTAANPGLDAAIAAAPFAAFEAAHRHHARIHCYRWVPDAAHAVIAAVPEDVRSAWLCALLIDRMAQFDHSLTASGLDAEFRLYYTDLFHLVLDQIDRDPGFASLSSDRFLKDLWLARVVMIPGFAAIYWPRAGLSAKMVLRGGVSAITFVLGRCRGRRPMLEGHTHDPMARVYWNPAGWGESMRLAALALSTRPDLRGVFGISWYHDPAVLRISPQLGYIHRLQLDRGAIALRVGSSQATIDHALAASAARRNRYRDGSYVPTDYAFIWSRRDMLRSYGPGSIEITD